MATERCEECGFDSEDWDDATAVEAIGRIPAQWHDAIAGLQPDALQRRPLPWMWSVAEYTDHVREVLFGMRFVLDSAVNQPGVNLGIAPEPEFTATPRAVEMDAALAGIDQEAAALRDRLIQLTEPSWQSTAIIAGDALDVHWICRHAVHDARHHMGDVAHLRGELR